MFHPIAPDQLSRITTSRVQGPTSCWGKGFRFHDINLDLCNFPCNLRKNVEYDVKTVSNRMSYKCILL